MESCTCPKCISACLNDPGRLVPEDLQKLAAELGMTEADVIATYLVKIPLTPGEHMYALAPAKRKGKRLLAEPGTVVPDYYAIEPGACIFFDGKGSCTVHAAKPFECKAYLGCKHTFLGKPYKKKYVEEYFLLRWRKTGIKL